MAHDKLLPLLLGLYYGVGATVKEFGPSGLAMAILKSKHMYETLTSLGLLVLCHMETEDGKGHWRLS